MSSILYITVQIKLSKDLNIKASLKYAHVFNNAHDVNVMFLYNRQSTTNEKGCSCSQ